MSRDEAFLLSPEPFFSLPSWRVEMKEPPWNKLKNIKTFSLCREGFIFLPCNN
jgi:hypothetical protein